MSRIRLTENKLRSRTKKRKKDIPKMNETALHPPCFFSTFSASKIESGELLRLCRSTTSISGGGGGDLEKLPDGRGKEEVSFLSFKSISKILLYSDILAKNFGVELML